MPGPLVRPQEMPLSQQLSLAAAALAAEAAGRPAAAPAAKVQLCTASAALPAAAVAALSAVGAAGQRAALQHLAATAVVAASAAAAVVVCCVTAHHLPLHAPPMLAAVPCCRQHQCQHAYRPQRGPAAVPRRQQLLRACALFLLCGPAVLVVQQAPPWQTHLWTLARPLLSVRHAPHPQQA